MSDDSSVWLEVSRATRHFIERTTNTHKEYIDLLGKVNDRSSTPNDRKRLTVLYNELKQLLSKKGDWKNEQ